MEQESYRGQMVTSCPGIGTFSQGSHSFSGHPLTKGISAPVGLYDYYYSS